MRGRNNGSDSKYSNVSSLGSFSSELAPGHVSDTLPEDFSLFSVFPPTKLLPPPSAEPVCSLGRFGEQLSLNAGEGLPESGWDTHKYVEEVKGKHWKAAKLPVDARQPISVAEDSFGMPRRQMDGEIREWLLDGLAGLESRLDLIISELSYVTQKMKPSNDSHSHSSSD